MDFGILFKIMGALGLLCITAGVLTRKSVVQQDLLFIIGGMLLELYSLYIKDPVFIVLQIVFIIAAVYGLEMNLREKKKLSHRLLELIRLK